MRTNLMIVFFGSLLLNGCGGHWVSKTQSPESLEKDIIRCKKKSDGEFPPKMQFTHLSSYNVATSTDRHGVNIRPTEQINIQEQDSNAAARDQAFKQCMQGMGWTLEY